MAGRWSEASLFLIGNMPKASAAMPSGDQFGQAIHVGSGMRVLMVPKTHNGNVNDLAETMYHELSHKAGGTHDITYNVDAARRGWS